MREAVLKSKNPREILKEIEEIEKMGELDYTFLVGGQSCLMHKKACKFFYLDHLSCLSNFFISR